MFVLLLPFCKLAPFDFRTVGCRPTALHCAVHAGSHGRRAIENRGDNAQYLYAAGKKCRTREVQLCIQQLVLNLCPCVWRRNTTFATQQDRLGKPTQASDLTKTTLGASLASFFASFASLVKTPSSFTFSGGAAVARRAVPAPQQKAYDASWHWPEAADHWLQSQGTPKSQ